MTHAPIAIVLSLALAWQPVAAQTNTVRPSDVDSPESVVRALYETVNRRPGERFGWDRLRTLFLPNAMMIPSRGQTGGDFRMLTVQQFTDWVDDHTVIGGAGDQGFQEEQIASRMERYGDIAQVFSSYQKRYWGASQILGRGINAIQLVHSDGRWWIVSIVWDEESDAGPLPERYRPS